MRSELACDPTFWTLPQVGEWVRCTIKEGAVVNTDMSFLSDQLFPLVVKIPTQISHKLWELERAHQGKSSAPFVPECGKKIPLSLSFLVFAMVGEIWIWKKMYFLVCIIWISDAVPFLDGKLQPRDWYLLNFLSLVWPRARPSIHVTDDVIGSKPRCQSAAKTRLMRGEHR